MAPVLLYRTLHHIHHKYNKEHTLSPFAGLAFHPLDGILQVLCYSAVETAFRQTMGPCIQNAAAILLWVLVPAARHMPGFGGIPGMEY